MTERTIRITNSDLTKLETLIKGRRRSSGRDLVHLTGLAAELERAEVAEDTAIPSDVITMHSRVLVQDLTTGAHRIYTLVFPNEADLALDKVSVLAPMGTALLGYRTGDIIAWNMPSGTKRLFVRAVLFQPEASGETVLGANRNASRSSIENALQVASWSYEKWITELYPHDYDLAEWHTGIDCIRKTIADLVNLARS